MFIPIDEKDSQTNDELQLIINARYKVWLRASEDMKRDALQKYEKLLYSRLNSAQHLDSPVLEPDELFDEFADDKEESEEHIFRCTKKACKRFNSVFAFESLYNDHLR